MAMSESHKPKGSASGSPPNTTTEIGGYEASPNPTPPPSYAASDAPTQEGDGGAYSEDAVGPPPTMANQSNAPQDKLYEDTVYELIHLERNAATIELTLTAITVAVIVLKVSFSELSKQMAALLAQQEVRTALDVSVSVGFMAIVVATIQIPRLFTDALIHSNQDALKIMSLLGATPSFIVRAFRKVVWRVMLKALISGLTISGFLYLAISEIAQIWAPSTRTQFLFELAESLAGIGAFMIAVQFLVAHKVRQVVYKMRL